MKTLFDFIKIASSTLKLKPYRGDLRTLIFVKKVRIRCLVQNLERRICNVNKIVMLSGVLQSDSSRYLSFYGTTWIYQETGIFGFMVLVCLEQSVLISSPNAVFHTLLDIFLVANKHTQAHDVNRTSNS